jgi:YidC/Oxa1 family membrane protein insertase
MFDRKTILAIIIVGVILLLLQPYYKLISPKRTEAPATAPAVTDTVAHVEPKPSLPIEKAEQATPKPEAVVAGVASTDTIPVDPEFVHIETPKFSMTIGSNAQVTGYILKEYIVNDGNPVSLHLVPGTSGESIGFLDFDFGTRENKSLNNNRFIANNKHLNLASGIDSIQLISADTTGRQIVLTYIFDTEHYGFDVSLSTKDLPIAETGEYRIRWIGGVPTTETDPVRDIQYAGAYAQVGDELEKVTTGRDREKEFTATGQTKFAAARSKYFIAAIIPTSPAAGVEIHGINNAPRDKASMPQYNLALRQAWGPAASGRWTVYWGPIRYKELKALNVGLEGTMNWGWAIIRPFSIAVLWALTALHKVIPNYGVVILIFSVAVKIILWPLTRKSQVSMKKMAALQPEITALRETHAKNPQAMNQAIMALYKERGVNPASGCIPLLLQMPLLYALFVIFSTTIEFRQAPFMLWITDLSLPDWVYTLPFSIPMYGAHVAILPLIMGITQFFMSKRTTTDPNQKFMLYIMPVFMLMIFNNLPSGLTFYYTLFNLIAIGEQYLIKVPDFTPSVEVMDEKKGKKR